METIVFKEFAPVEQMVFYSEGTKKTLARLSVLGLVKKAVKFGKALSFQVSS